MTVVKTMVDLLRENVLPGKKQNANPQIKHVVPSTNSHVSSVVHPSAAGLQGAQNK